MGYCLEKTRMDEILAELSGSFHIYGPRLDARKKKVRFGKITSVSQIVTDRQSDFSAKEVYYPISQVMFYFREDKVEVSELKDDRDILIFARACDLNAIRSLDHIFLKNGNAEDLFYSRIRSRVRFVLMECQESFEHCFCASLGTNRAEGYAMAVRFRDEDLLVQSCDEKLNSFFEKEKSADYEVRFVEENQKKLRIPEISRENLKQISDLPFWKKFDESCVSCSGCNTVCGTCSCFDTVDVVYDEGSNDGERRRVWSGCMLDDFTLTAGGSRARQTPGANMRFKLFHKFYDYKDRFGDGHMCVGCGRCDMQCPQEISFFDTVCELSDEINHMSEAKRGDM
ncbi:MAG: anaerobic sulfite reductase subunit A [Parasporobacterium sp.]|nr:anaerobic sulfite reductase subunit A [Parasporobacterium sp.]